MKLLLDSCVWNGARAALTSEGHEVEWVGSWKEDPGDEALLAHAADQGRTLVTLDKDFGELAVVHGRPHSGIVRLVGFSARKQGPICAAALERYAEELTEGAIVTVEPGRTRVRRRE